MLALVAACGLGHPADAGSLPPISIGRATPADLYGPLYEAVELAHVFPDSKTFADLVPNEDPARIVAVFLGERPQGREALAAFVAHHFRHAGGADGGGRPSMADHIRMLWPILAKPPLAVPAGSSLLPLDDSYVVAGGRYQEMYYWDSYFTMLGLKADGEQPLVEAMLANFVALVERYGHVPNGTRTYYLSRSQPPFLALMMDLSGDRDPAMARRRLAALKREHAYWMAGARCLAGTDACAHVVRMPDGSLLNRYWDERDTPRDESYAEDRATTAVAAPRPVNRELRAGAESGWDFSSRWLKDGRTLATIRTTELVPVDLNSLLWALERSIARRCDALGDGACRVTFDKAADARKAAIGKYLWSEAEQRFGDWDRIGRHLTGSISAAVLYPLFVGLADQRQAAATAQLVESRLLAPAGLRTTTIRTGQQWDRPNGWAPLQWIAIQGLDRYGKAGLADAIAVRWIATVSRFYACTGRMIEKYDVETGAAGGGGEYPVQDGFGWTNGVTRALLDRPGAYGAIISSCSAAAQNAR